MNSKHGRRAWIFLWLFYGSISLAQAGERPKLIIGMVLDQMRWDYTQQFSSRFVEDGFSRILNGGFCFEQAFIPYVPTYTAPGHATIYTGTVPSIHGIVGNDWVDRTSQRSVYCVDDKGYETLGGPGVDPRSGQKSPRQLRTSTVGDELKLRTKESRVLSISLKDRGAVIPAGHLGDEAIWLDDLTGTWVSSSYYGSSLPGWVQDLNQEKWADRLYQDWELLHPSETYLSPLPDDNPYEGNLSGWGAGAFPHRLPQGSKKDYSLHKYMPSGNELVFEAAKAGIRGRQLGQREGTDFLALSFSATDYAGHLFGPASREVEDMYLRFDRSLAAFLRFLDQHLGEDNYLLFLTADHGAASNPRYLADLGIPAGIFPEASWRQELAEVLKQAFGVDSLIRKWMNDQIYLNDQQRKAHGITLDQIDPVIDSFLASKQGLSGWIPLHHLYRAWGRWPENLVSMITKGYMPGRSGDYHLLNLPGWYGSTYMTGTTHGSWNPYDTHIPLIWYGASIPQGKSWRKVSMEDIAPSLCALLGIEAPNGSTGEVLVEIMEVSGSGKKALE